LFVISLTAYKLQKSVHPFTQKLVRRLVEPTGGSAVQLLPR